MKVEFSEIQKLKIERFGWFIRLMRGMKTRGVRACDDESIDKSGRGQVRWRIELYCCGLEVFP